jgi:hypothetical protein
VQLQTMKSMMLRSLGTLLVAYWQEGYDQAEGVMLEVVNAEANMANNMASRTCVEELGRSDVMGRTSGEGKTFLMNFLQEYLVLEGLIWMILHSCKIKLDI